MPNTCSAPNCRSNYKGEPYTPIFALPKCQDLAQKWLRAICREGASDLKSVYVCIKHFRDEDIQRKFIKVMVQSNMLKDRSLVL